LSEPSYCPQDITTECPTIVFVYGGSLAPRNPSNTLWRGGVQLPHSSFARYAIFFPSSHLRTGETKADLIAEVMPGVNQIVELGYADPDRLATMGQSYGTTVPWYSYRSLLDSRRRSLGRW